MSFFEEGRDKAVMLCLMMREMSIDRGKLVVVPPPLYISNRHTIALTSFFFGLVFLFSCFLLIMEGGMGGSCRAGCVLGLLGSVVCTMRAVVFDGSGSP